PDPTLFRSPVARREIAGEEEGEVAGEVADGPPAEALARPVPQPRPRGVEADERGGVAVDLYQRAELLGRGVVPHAERLDDGDGDGGAGLGRLVAVEADEAEAGRLHGAVHLLGRRVGERAHGL